MPVYLHKYIRDPKLGIFKTKEKLRTLSADYSGYNLVCGADNKSFRVYAPHSGYISSIQIKNDSSYLYTINIANLPIEFDILLKEILIRYLEGTKSALNNYGNNSHDYVYLYTIGWHKKTGFEYKTEDWKIDKSVVHIENITCIYNNRIRKLDSSLFDKIIDYRPDSTCFQVLMYSFSSILLPEREIALKERAWQIARKLTNASI